MSDNTTTGPAVNVTELKQLVEQIERLEEDKAGISADIKDKYQEAKARGYDVAAMRSVIRMRKKDTNQRQEEEAILEVYRIALGMEGPDNNGNYVS